MLNGSLSLFMFSKLLQSSSPYYTIKELVLGFVVNTRGNAFSRISLDQAQDHNNNNKIKSMAGYIDFVSQEDKEYLRNVEH